MQKNFLKKKYQLLINAVLVLLAIISLQACKKNPLHNPFENDFNQVNLVANNSSYSPVTVDANLLNAWGLAFAPTGPAWVSANGSGLSTIYSSTGSILRPPVTIPTNGAATGGTPTGQVFNASTGFRLSNGNAAKFIFVGEDGIISGWNGGNAAEVALNNNATAVYKGVTIAMNNNVPYLYAANFKTRKVEVYDTLWNAVAEPFNDPYIPANYSPFNVQNIGGKIYVLYAQLGDGLDEAHGPGTGIIDIYNPDGSLARRFTSHGVLNAPWGIAWTPASFFGSAANTATVILVGNFGDGRINAFDESGNFLGPLKSKGKPVVIDGLWALSFAPVTATSIDADWLFFTAGPNDEADGLFGYLAPVPKK